MKRLHKRFLLATFCALFTATLQAADVTITVNGRVVAKPCTIQTKEANVNLGDLYTRNLQQPGSASGWHNITLSLTDCPVETSAVTAIVTGSTDNTGWQAKFLPSVVMSMAGQVLEQVQPLFMLISTL